MKILIKKIVIASFAVVMFSFSFGQKPALEINEEQEWQKIGETTATFKKQSGSIHVYGADEFSAIKLKVLYAPVTIERVQVFYEAGKMEDIELYSQLYKNEETKTINLKKPEGAISRVTFTYMASPHFKNKKTTIMLYGLKADDGKAESYGSGKSNLEGTAEDATMIRDKRVENKVGPKGEYVYVDGESRYYYVNDRGEQVYITGRKDVKERSNE